MACGTSILDQRFGRERVLGGQCLIAVTVKDGEIVHLTKPRAVFR